MLRSRHAVLLALTVTLATVLLTESVGAAHVPQLIPIALDVDPTTRLDRDLVFLGFTVLAKESGTFNYQLGVARPGTCVFRSAGTDGPSGPALLDADPASEPRVLFRTANADEPPVGRPLRVHGPAEAAPSCPPADTLRFRLSEHAPDVQWGVVLRDRLEANHLERREAFLRLAELEDPLSREEIRNGRYFIRLWQEDADEAVVVGLGASYAPEHDTPGVAADMTRLTILHTATALMACIAAAGVAAGAMLVHRWRDEDPPPPWPIIFLFTRLNSSRLLHHKTRRHIHDIVQANPGIRFGELRHKSGLATGVLTHHLHNLETHGLLVTVRRGRQRHLYPKPAPKPDERGELTERQHEILVLLTSRRCTQSEIASVLNVSQQAVSYHIRRLAEKGFLAPGRRAASA